MKTILILVFILISLDSWSQNYNRLLDNNKKWNVLETQLLTCSCVDYRTHSFYIGTDTIIDTKSYRILIDTLYTSNASHIVLTTPEISGFIREDTITKKVFFKPVGDYVYEPEYLLYDFSLDTNSIFIYRDQDTLHVILKDSILIDNEYSKRIKLRYSTVEITWIEGLGSLQGLLYSQSHNLFQDRDLLCYWKNDSLIYTKNDSIYNCLYADFISTIPEVDGQLQYKIYPNPVTNYLYIESVGDNVVIKIYDIKGIELFNNGNLTNSTKINMSSYENGLYFLQINNDRFKIIKN